MKNVNLSEIKQNFTQAAKQFQLSDCFSLKPFSDRYQATLILGAYSSALFLSPIIVNLLLVPLDSLLMAVGIAAIIYGAYHLYHLNQQADEASIKNKEADAHFALKAGYGAFGISFIISFAQQVLPLLIGAVMAHRIIQSIDEETWRNLEKIKSPLSFAK